MPTTFRVGGAALAAVLSAPSAVALAQPVDPRFVEAQRACAAADVDRGVRLMSDIYAQVRDPGLFYEQGRCYMQGNRPREAAGRYREYLRWAQNLPPDKRAELEAHVRDLEGRGGGWDAVISKAQEQEKYGSGEGAEAFRQRSARGVRIGAEASIAFAHFSLSRDDSSSSSSPYDYKPSIYSPWLLAGPFIRSPLSPRWDLRLGLQLGALPSDDAGFAATIYGCFGFRLQSADSPFRLGICPRLGYGSVVEVIAEGQIEIGATLGADEAWEVTLRAGWGGTSKTHDDGMQEAGLWVGKLF